MWFTLQGNKSLQIFTNKHKAIKMFHSNSIQKILVYSTFSQIYDIGNYSLFVMRITQSMTLNNTLKQNSIHNTQINAIIIDVFSPICVSDENYCCLERRETKYKEKPDAKEKVSNTF